MDYFIGRGIDKEVTGIEKAQLNRLTLFKQKKRPAKILRFSYSRKAAQDAASVGLTADDVISIFDWYQESLNVPLQLITPAMVQPADTTVLNAGQENEIQAVNFVRGQQVVSQARFDRHTQALINVLWPDSNGRVLRTDSYDVRGFLALSSFFTSVGKLDHEHYLTPAGKVAIAIAYNGDKQRGVRAIKLADGQEFSKLVDWQDAFLQTLDQLEPSRFFFDRGYSRETMTKLPLQGKKFFVLHNNHRTYDEIMKSTKASVLQNIGVSSRLSMKKSKDAFGELSEPGNIDAVITGTPQQKQALEEDFPAIPPVYVVPAGVTVNMPKRVTFSDRDPQELIVISRISTEKGIEGSVETLIKLRQEFPKVHMSLYGGPNGKIGQAYLRQLNEHILKAGAADNITFMGFRANLDAVYDHAAMLVTTSHTEAFPVSLEESLSHGCPVISYDIDFGPRDMIEDGVNGKLVPHGDLDGMVNVIANLLRNPAELQSLSNGAYRLRKKYGADAVWAQYQQLPQ